MNLLTFTRPIDANAIYEKYHYALLSLGKDIMKYQKIENQTVTVNNYSATIEGSIISSTKVNLNIMLTGGKANIIIDKERELVEFIFELSHLNHRIYTLLDTLLYVFTYGYDDRCPDMDIVPFTRISKSPYGFIVNTLPYDHFKEINRDVRIKDEVYKRIIDEYKKNNLESILPKGYIVDIERDRTVFIRTYSCTITISNANKFTITHPIYNRTNMESGALFLTQLYEYILDKDSARVPICLKEHSKKCQKKKQN